MKKLLSLLFIVYLSFSSAVSAHTDVKNASPAEGETVTENIQELQLEFETTIENGSTLSLLSKSGTEVSIKGVQLTGNKMTALTAEPLKNGPYTANWRIVGKDGHLIEGSYSFNVQQESGNQESLAATGEKAEVTDRAADTQELVEESNPSTAAAASEEQSQSKTNIVISLLTGFMLFVVLQTVMWLVRRGRK
ncbi:copper resistance CopC family protein [Domibacillus robiginosus]|uniref:copper resistance CopC family protein n=1 Tax=Domibacillus robiginosus TaxID=1071054 RepID=UPI000AB1213C|nr:copper resistance CopC family protein [Domibacillus robiginosus]